MTEVTLLQPPPARDPFLAEFRREARLALAIPTGILRGSDTGAFHGTRIQRSSGRRDRGGRRRDDRDSGETRFSREDVASVRVRAQRRQEAEVQGCGRWRRTAEGRYIQGR